MKLWNELRHTLRVARYVFSKNRGGGKVREYYPYFDRWSSRNLELLKHLFKLISDMHTIYKNLRDFKKYIYFNRLFTYKLNIVKSKKIHNFNYRPTILSNVRIVMFRPNNVKNYYSYILYPGKFNLLGIQTFVVVVVFLLLVLLFFCVVFLCVLFLLMLFFVVFVFIYFHLFI